MGPEDGSFMPTGMTLWFAIATDRLAALHLYGPAGPEDHEITSSFRFSVWAQGRFRNRLMIKPVTRSPPET